jgi:DNA-binding CsgD family transcriptional regulator
MLTLRLDRTLALGVLAVAVFSALAAVSMPVPAWRVGMTATATLTALLGLHAGLYWWADRIRARFGLGGYVAAQAAVVFCVALTGALFPVGLALYLALTAEVVVVAGERWGTVPITFGAIVLFGASAIAASDLYRGATAGLLLAITGVLAHATAALVRRRGARGSPPGAGPSAAIVEAAGPPHTSDLTPREVEVLRVLASGARTSDIAAKLGIAERTVKAHLAGIYQKLGVESRTAAVALALQRKLV